MNINWFPGHMAKTRRLISDNLKLVDIVVELKDARIPYSSSNPIISEILGSKAKIIALNKCDLANHEALKEWIKYYKSLGITAVPIDSIKGTGINVLKNEINTVLKDKFEAERQKGMKSRPIRMMVVGIPNVGKSSFINKLCGRASAKTGDRPGVTTAKQWLRISGGYELLDTPGILWPKFEDEFVGKNLAFTGAIREEVYDIAEVACELCAFIAKKNSEVLCEIYKLNTVEGLLPYEILFEIGKKRGCLISGGEIDYDRAAKILLDEFRSNKLGKIALETPDDIKDK
ncbi:MAG: ribosome biogenesis GTPase YlqF [Clostridia bacterium]|nr:ribosome biogenesis GTPase YlqF [Clostridia bacterium]